MLDLHEHLSEFSYGYGITRETERLLNSVGIKTAPFLPSLVHEAVIGYDVKFDRKGAPLLLQFKLGQSLKRFRKSNAAETVPEPLNRPFWRFWVDTLEFDGQFDTLLKAEQNGAETYYVAPRFVDWSEYLKAFEAEEVLERSLLIKPSEIDQQLVTDGWHRVVYDDQKNCHVCSEPARIESVEPHEIAQRLRARIAEQPSTLGQAVRHVFFGLSDRRLIRKEIEPTRVGSPEDKTPEESVEFQIRRGEAKEDRQKRLESFRSRSRSEDDAFAAALGIEVWSLGIQIIFATED